MVVVGFDVALTFDALTLEGVLALNLDADVLEVTLVGVVLPVDCARDVEATLAVLPVLLAVATPPLVDTRLVNTLSDPVLCLEPCQLSSLIGPTWMWW